MANLLLNPTFEAGTTLATSWVEEHTTATVETFSLVASVLPSGGNAQRMQYTGEGTNNGTQKVEFYQQTSVGSYAPGDTATFDVWLWGSVTGTGTYCNLALEAHAGAAYIAEVDQLCHITSVPQLFRIAYPNLPATTDSVIAVIQAPQLGTDAAIDINADLATLINGAASPALGIRTNLIDHPSFELGSTLATGWTESNSITGSVTYSLPTTSVTYGTKKQNAQFTAPTQTNKVVQLISNSSANGTVAPGDTVAFSLLVDGTKTGCNFILRIQFLTSAGASAGTADSAALTVTGTPTRLSITAVAPATTAACRALIRITSVDTGDTFNLNWDGALLENSSSVGSYIDGDQPGYRWTGTANASTSESRSAVGAAAPVAGPASIGGIGAESGSGTAGLLAGAAIVAGTGAESSTSSAALAGQAAAVVGAGAESSTGGATPLAGPAAVGGIGAETENGSAALVDGAAVVNAAGTMTATNTTGTASLVAQVAELVALGVETELGSAGNAAAPAGVAAAGTMAVSGTAAPAAGAATVTATGLSFGGMAVVLAQPAAVSGSGSEQLTGLATLAAIVATITATGRWMIDGSVTVTVGAAHSVAVSVAQQHRVVMTVSG